MKYAELQVLLKKYDKKICDSVNISNIHKNMEIAALIEKRMKFLNKMRKKKKSIPFKSHYPKGYGLISSYQDKTQWNDYFFWVSCYTYSINLRYLERK